MSTKFYAWQPLIIIAAIYFVDLCLIEGHSIYGKEDERQ